MAGDAASLRDCPTSPGVSGDTPPSPVLEVILEQMDVSSGPDLPTVYSATYCPERLEQVEYEGSDMNVSSVEQLTSPSPPAPSPSNEMEVRSVALEEEIVSSSALNTGSCSANEGRTGASTSNTTYEEGEVRGKINQVEGRKQPKRKLFSLVCQWGNFLDSQDMVQQLGQGSIVEEEEDGQEEEEVEVVVVGTEEVVEVAVEEMSVYSIPREGNNMEAVEEEEEEEVVEEEEEKEAVEEEEEEEEEEKEEEVVREELDDKQERNSEEERKLGCGGGGGKQFELREEEEQRVEGQEGANSIEEQEEEEVLKEEKDEKQMVWVVEEEMVEKERDGLEEGKEGGKTHGTTSKEQSLPSGVPASTDRNTDDKGEADSLEMFLPSLPNLYQRAGVGSWVDSAPSSDEGEDIKVATRFLVQEEDLLRSCGWATDHSCSTSRGSRRHQPKTVVGGGDEMQCVGGASDSLTTRPHGSPQHPPYISHRTLPHSSPSPPAHVLPTASSPPHHHHPHPLPSHGLLEAAVREGLGVVASGSRRREDEESDSSFLYHLSGQGREGEEMGGKLVTLETSSASEDDMQQQQQSKESRLEQERAHNNHKSVPAAEMEDVVGGECLSQHQVGEYSLKPVHRATAVSVVEESGRGTSSDEHGVMHLSSSHGLTAREREKKSSAVVEVVMAKEKSEMKEGRVHITEGGGEAEDTREGGRKRKREIERNTTRDDTSEGGKSQQLEEEELDMAIKALMADICPPGFSNVFSPCANVSNWDQLQQFLDDIILSVATKSTIQHSGAIRGHYQSHRKHSGSVTEEEDITTAEDEPRAIGRTREDELWATEDEDRTREDGPEAIEDVSRTRVDEGRTREDEGRIREDEPMATEDEDRTREDEPMATEDELRVTEDEGRTREDEGRTREDEPMTTEDEPRTTEDKPRATESETVAAKEASRREPGMTGEEVEETGSPSRTMTAEEQRRIAQADAVVGSSKHMTGEGKILY